MEFQNNEESWSIEEELDLIKNIQEILPEKEDKKSYKTTLSNFDWNKISTQTKSPENCREHFYKLKSKICPLKSLNQIISEINVILQDPKLRKAQIPAPYNTFRKNYFKENKNKLKDSNSNLQMLCSEGAKAWKELPNNIRQLYKDQYKEQLKLKNLNTITKSKSSFSHFLQDVFDKCQMSKDNRRKAWESWCQLSFEEKLPYIKMSIEDEARCKDELAEYLLINQNAETFPVIGPTWEEKEKYLIYTGLPKAPPKTCALFFLEKHKDFEEYKLGSQKLIVSCQVFKSQPTDVQKLTKKDFHEAWNKYYFELNDWKAQQTSLIQNISELYIKRKKIMFCCNTKRKCKDNSCKAGVNNLGQPNYSPDDDEQPHTSYKLQDNENFSKVFETPTQSTVQRVKNTSTAAKKRAITYNGSPSFGRKRTLSFHSAVSSSSSDIKQSNKQKSNVGIKRKNKINHSVSKKTKGECVSNKENQYINSNKQLDIQDQQHESTKFPEVVGEPKPVAKTPWLYCLSEQRTILGSPGKARQKALKLYKENESAIKTVHDLKVKEYKESIQIFFNSLPNEYKKAYLESQSNQIDDTKYINIFQELLDSHFDKI